MKIVSYITQYLLAAVFLVFGLNGFFGFIHAPMPTGAAGEFFGVLYSSHYLYVIFGFQVLCGALLLLNVYVPLALAMLAPMLVNILSFHFLVVHGGYPIPLVVAAVWLICVFTVRKAYVGLFKQRAPR